MTSPFDELLRIEGGRVLATLIRLTGDIGLAEDAVQEAVVVALERWPLDGMPRNPAAWLTTTARNKALDRIRRESKRVAKEQSALTIRDHLIGTVAGSDAEFDELGQHDLAQYEQPSAIHRDDQLRLLFTCCHPALAHESRVALALRTICRLTTGEIARVHLVAESTMAQRITRVKRKIAVAEIPYRVPDDHELPDRLPAVLATLYAVFTVGHHATSGRLDQRVDLAGEGVRLGRVVYELMPDEPECMGLLALMLATHARRDARLDDAGDIQLMADQDRTLWHHDEIAEASALVERVLPRRRIGPYQLQAAISCLHGLAKTFDDTDWPQIAELYEMLEHFQPTAVVLVNRAVAVGFAQGPRSGLALLDSVAGRVDHWHLYWSTLAELQRRCGDVEPSRVSFERALTCEMNDSDRAFLQRRISEAR